jgi:hypothetical protein
MLGRSIFPVFATLGFTECTSAETLPAFFGFHAQHEAQDKFHETAGLPVWQKSLFDAGDYDVVRIDHLGEMDFCHL